MATLQEYMARRQMQSRGTQGSQGKYWWERESEDEDVLTAARRAGLYGSVVPEVEEERKAGLIERVSETGLDITGNIISGAMKSLEGIIDLGISGTGWLAGIFSKRARDEMRKWVEYDVTGQHIQPFFDASSDDSYLNNNKVGGFIEKVASGVGQLLPAVAVSVATGGSGAPAMYAMLASGASAAGNATEEAFQEGADYSRGMIYGGVSGGIEMVTEKLFGGMGGLMGGGMLDNVTRSVAKTGAARVVKEAVQEGAEEALAEVANPLAKTIYKGRDALSDYGEADYWGGVGEAALVGAATSAAYGGTIGRVAKTGGKYADVQAVKDEVEAINKKRSNLYINGKLTDAQEEILQKSEVANYRVLERLLQKSSDKKRADLIKRGGLAQAFDESGTLRTDFLRSLGERVVDGQTDTPDANEAQGAKSAAVDRRYVSPSLYYKTDVIERDLEAIGSKTGTVAKVFEGELDEAAQGNYKKLKRALAALNRAGGNNVSLVITEANDKYNGGLVNGRTIYLGADRLSGADYAKTLVHEFTHFEEGTVEYSKMLDFLSSDDITVDDGKGGSAVLHDRAEAAVKRKKYGIDLEGIRAAIKKEKAGEAITAEEADAIRLYVSEVTAHESEMLLGNEAFIDRIVREDGSFAEKIVSRVLSLDKAFAKLGDKEARAQHKIVRQAERLYLKAAEAAGDGRIARMILSQTPELEEEQLTGMNEEKMQVSERKVQLNLKDQQIPTREQLEKKPPVSIVDISTPKTQGRFAERRKQILASAKEVIKKPYLNRDTNTLIFITNHSYTHAFSNGGELQLNAAEHLPELVENAVLTHSEPPSHGSSHAEGVYTFFAAVRRGEKVQPIKLKVKEYAYNGQQLPQNIREYFNDVMQDYASVYDTVVLEVEEIEESSVGSAKDFDLNDPSLDPKELSNISIADLLNLVKGDAKNYVPEHTKNVQLSLKDSANQHTSDDIDELMRSAGIEGDAAEIREDLAELYVKAENLAMDEDAKSGKAFVERVAKRIALNMARLGTVRDGETQEAMAERLREEILSRSAFAEQEAEATKEATKETPKDEPKPKKTGYTYDDVHAMMDAVKKMLAFEMSSGRVVEGKIYRNDAWEVNKKIYQVLKAGELRKKSEVAREIADMIVDVIMVQERDAYGKVVQKRLSGVLHGEELEAARQEIALEVAVQMGDREAKKYNKRMGDLKYEAQRLSNMKAGRYVNASGYKGDTFKKALSELSRVNWRGGLVSSKKIRERFAQLSEWYTPSNPLYGDGGVKNEQFRQSIFDALDFVGDTTRGVLTMEDIDAAEMILKYFIREIETYGTIFKNGKREDAVPSVKGYIGKIGMAKEVAGRSGILQGILRSKFARLAADPAMLFREADAYMEGGFFTEQFQELRRGTIEAAVKEHELIESFVEFWEKNKSYGKRYNDTGIKYGGKTIPLQEAISLYMTMKREHAFAGLAYAGFEIEGKTGTVNVSDGFGELVEKHKIDLINELPPEKALNMTKADEESLHSKAIERAVGDMQSELYAQFTAEDKRLIAIMERGFDDCREIKIKIDNILMGDSNVTGGYYYPIKRTGLAESIDVMSVFEGDRVSNLSFNKDTVKNAHKLLIEPVHIVYMRHIKAISLYDGLGVFTDNFNRMYNLNIGDSANNPITIRTELAKSSNYVKEMVAYFKEIKQDVEGVSKKRSSERFYNDAVAAIRSAYASYQLGFNPKTWASQLSSLIASINKVDADSVLRGLSMRGTDVDKYCKLAWLRNNNGDAVLAQSVTTGMNPVQRAGRNGLQRVRDAAMWPIGKVDRIVVEKLFAACQVQVEKDQKLAVGSEANKVAAGELLETVILETQQNSMATERTAAMRSGDEFLKSFNMFIADAMKTQARMIEPYAHAASIRTQIRMAKEQGNTAEVARLEKELAVVRKECARSTAVLVSVAVFNALLAYGFKVLFRRDEEETVGTVAADAFGNMIGGIPFVRDAYSYFVDGFEVDNFVISTLNDVLKTTADTAQLLQDAAEGKDVSKQEATRAVRDVLYAAGQLSGVPTRNLYNNVTGIINRVSSEAGYRIEGSVYKQSYRADLAAAIEADDEGMISLIASMMVEEKVGNVDAELSAGLRELVAKGYDVLPRVLGDSITYDGEEIELTKRQRERFKAVYAIAQEQIGSMMKLRQYAAASEEVRAKAIKMIWEAYWDLAVDDVLGVDSSEKNVLFAEAIDMDKLALIVATAREIKADYNEGGKAISGTRLAKIEAYVETLRLKAAQKYMVMGYLGYKNKNGEDKVRAYVGGLSKLSAAEKEKLMEYAGYGNG